MPLEIKVIFVSSAIAQPEVKDILPIALDYQELFGHDGLYVRSIFPQVGSACGEVLYCVSDAKHRGLPLSRRLDLPDYIYPVYGPFLIVGLCDGQEISLSGTRLEYWKAELKLTFN